MNDTNSLAHTKWNCKYHIVFAPKISCICAEISAQGILRRKAQGDRKNPAAVVRMEKGGDCRSGGVSRSHTYAS